MIKQPENIGMTEQGMFSNIGGGFDRQKPQKESVQSDELETWNKEWLLIKEQDWEADFGLVVI